MISTRFFSQALLPLVVSAVPMITAHASVPSKQPIAKTPDELITVAKPQTNALEVPTGSDEIIAPSNLEIIAQTERVKSRELCEADILHQVDGVNFEYDAQIRSVSVQSNRRISSTQSGLWQMHSKAQWLFLSIEETSVFMMPSWKLHHFEHKRSGLGQSKDLEITVDHQNHSYLSETAKGDRTLNFEDELYDSLNYQLRLQLDVACDPNTTQFHYPIAKKKGVRDYYFTRLEDERVKTEVGEFDAVKLIKEEDNGKRKTTVWLAKDLAYSVVKLDHTEGDKTDSLSISNKPKLNEPSREISER
ncbi:DUF3108 domain-containing protein [Sessilibacter corallicola]|uniref:DUF3108 domain-containing protein n=1 Tax=Sessilibacter corallicola TaxID=2904075 RepID=A0ABQ0A8S1_9GAMM